MPPGKDIRHFFKPLPVPGTDVATNNVREGRAESATANGTDIHDPPTPPQDRCDAPPNTSPFSSALTLLPGSPVESSPAALLHLDAAASPTPSSSTHRTLLVGQRPSVPPQQSNDEPGEPCNTAKISFSSTSSLTSVPPNTQSSSRRIIKNGMPAVANSDSEGGGDASSSDSSSENELPDVSELISGKRIKLDPDAQKLDKVLHRSNDAKTSKRKSSRLSASTNRTTRLRTPRREKTPPQKAYKHSLLSMARHKEQEEESEIKIRQLETEFDKTEHQRQEETRTEDGKIRVKRTTFSDDSDGRDRMNQAMQRTKVQDCGDELFFFRGLRDELNAGASPPRSSEAPFHRLARSLKDKSWRDQACLTGFLAEVTARHGLPPPLRDWFCRELLQEGREDLCEAYVGIIVASSSDDRSANGSMLCLQDFYHVLPDPGTEQSNPQSLLLGSTSRPPRALKHVIHLLKHSTVQAGDNAIGLFVSQLMHAAIDVTVHSDSYLQHLIADSIEYLLNNARDADRVAMDVCTAFSRSELSTMLKCRAILSLPASSERIHTLRRCLAIDLIFAQHLAAPPWSVSHVDYILDRLRDAPEFRVSESSDYAQLIVLVSVLDIAIDSGFTEPGFKSREVAQAATAKKKVSFIGDAAPVTAEDEEKAFNKQVDAFIQQLTLMSSKIKDAGTANLQRTEAKHAIERLTSRLEYSVRTRPRPRKKTFGGTFGETQRTFMSTFMSRIEMSSTLKGGEGHAVDAISAVSPRNLEAVMVPGAADLIAAGAT